MVKLIPLSIVLASIIIPILLAEKPGPKKTVRTLQVTMAIVTLAWALLCLHVYPAYVLPE
jgi:hypothetical protein